jgi:hypothetical protein
MTVWPVRLEFKNAGRAPWGAYAEFQDAAGYFVDAPETAKTLARTLARRKSWRLVVGR